MSKEHNIKLEEAIKDMMVNFKYTPIDLGKIIPKNMYNNIYEKWKFALFAKRKIKETTLV